MPLPGIVERVAPFRRERTAPQRYARAGAVDSGTGPGVTPDAAQRWTRAASLPHSDRGGP
ncbi:hypothetical protein [Streptomyces mangrovisoli]|uniref:Uncharacterized protein n=1 Tax=Streptomyces mangrovisoli TaxID=1428628 RepID=A0A1J4P1A0_9ACTN|nr:hypothetical protein [Streptomyces mangrovisoli]OIJ68379.1 hypothetical protein WN71_008125 [Streptomyces mangrovisoli]